LEFQVDGEEPLGEPLQRATSFAVVKLAAVDLQKVARRCQAVADSRKVRAGGGEIVWEREFGNAVGLKRVLAGQMKLTLEIALGDLQVPHGHADVIVPEQLLEGRKAHAEAQHFRGVGVSKTVRGNPVAAARPLSRLDQSALEGLIQAVMSAGVWK